MEAYDINKLKKQTLISIFILALGMLVITYGIMVEDEPTAVGLLLTLSGGIWFFITRLRIRSRAKMNQQNSSN